MSAATLANLPQRGIFHMALLANEVVGFQSLEPFAACSPLFEHVAIFGTYAAAANRRQGVAAALFAATVAVAQLRAAVLQRVISVLQRGIWRFTYPPSATERQR